MSDKFDQSVRLLIKEYLKKLNKELRYGDKKLKLSHIDDAISDLFCSSKESQKGIRKNLLPQLSYSYLCISCLYYLSLSVHNDKEDKGTGLFPKNYLSPKSNINPNFVFNCLLINITNFAVSIIGLIESGQDNAARVLLRSLTELCWQTLILFANKDDLLEYVKPTNKDKEETEKWYRLFGSGRMNRKLKRIEKLLGFPEDIFKLSYKKRRSDREFFSKSVHHSLITSTIGAYSWDFKGDMGHHGFLGKASKASIPTVESLYYTLWYFISIFINIRVKIHKTDLGNPEEDFWHEAIALCFCVKDIRQK